MVTLIDTPPNIIIASFRERALGAPFGMFDFIPGGAAVALVGIAFVGWRLIPGRDDKETPQQKLLELGRLSGRIDRP